MSPKTDAGRPQQQDDFPRQAEEAPPARTRKRKTA